MSGSTSTTTIISGLTAAQQAQLAAQGIGPIPPGGTPTAPPAGGTPVLGNAASATTAIAPGGSNTQGGNLNGATPVANALGWSYNGTSTSQSAGGLPAPAPAQQNLIDAAGRRVRLRPKPGAMGQILGSSGLMSPLNGTNGMVFPYQPTVTWSQDVTYTQMEIVHANQDFYSYSKTPALKLTVDGDFTVQNQTEGLYSLACIQFLRTVTKMWFGGNTTASQNLAGTPPPVLLFDAYGQLMFNALPVIVTQFAVTLPKDVDYVPVQTGLSADGTGNGNPQPLNTALAANVFNSMLSPTAAAGSGTQPVQGFAWLPSVFSISVQLTVQNTPNRLRAFDLDQFRTGQLLTQGSWI